MPAVVDFAGGHACAGLVEIFGFEIADEEAVRTAEELPRILPENWEAYRLTAKCYCHCLPVARRDDRLTGKQREEKARDYADRAVALLRTALEKGMRELDAVEGGSAFEALHANEGYQQLAREVRQKRQDLAPEPAGK